MKRFRQTKKTPAQKLKITLGSALVVVALEVAMKHWLATNDVVAALLAGGGSAPYLHIMLALCFVLLRMFVFLLLPGIIARDLFLFVVGSRVQSRPG